MVRPLAAALACLPLATATLAADTVSLAASRDNTLFEESGLLSNGAGDYLFAGRTLIGDARRALLYFDMSSIPAGSTILSARLSLFMSMTIAADVDVSLHRVISDWGEGTSDAANEEGKGAAATPGDATWLHTFAPSDLWGDVGGDFISLASAVSIVNDVGIYRWEANDMTVLDVQGWLDAPSTNFGWIVRGDESTNTTAKRFNSRENPDAATRPTLEIVYAGAGELIFFDRFESGNTSSWSQTWP